MEPVLTVRFPSPTIFVSGQWMVVGLKKQLHERRTHESTVCQVRQEEDVLGVRDRLLPAIDGWTGKAMSWTFATFVSLLFISCF